MKTSPATYLLSVLLLWLLLPGMCPELEARQRLGVIWEVPEQPAEASDELQVFSEIGVEYLEVSHPVNNALLKLIEQYDFSVLVNLDQTYLTLHEMTTERERLFDLYQEAATHYRTHFEIAGLGLLANSQVHHPEFETRFSPILDSLALHSNKAFYFQNSGQWFYFDAPRQPFGRLVFDHSFQKHDLSEVQRTFKKEMTDASDFIYFLHSQWLLDAFEGYPEFKKSLVNYHETGSWSLPLPEVDSKTKRFNWPVLLLLCLWGALAVQLKYFPYIRPMMLRYFLAHRFYVDDILQYRERAALGGNLMMLKHALFGGLVCYLSAQILLSEQGLAALYHHYPALAVTGNNYVSLFFLGILLIVVLQTLSVFWLYLPAKNLNHLSQVINLYAGSFYLDFILVTVMITAFLANLGDTFILSLAVLYLVVWFSAFNIAAINASGNMGPYRRIYLLLTVVLQAVCLIAFMILLISQTNIFQVLDLAISI